MILNNVNKTRGLLRKLHNILPKPTLLTIYIDTQTTFEAQFTKGLSNTEAQLKKSITYEKSVYLFHCPRLNRERQTLPSTKKNIHDNLLDMTKPILTSTIIFGSNSFDINTNSIVSNSTMNLVYLLKDLTNHFFIELADYCRNEVLNLFD